MLEEDVDHEVRPETAARRLENEAEVSRHRALSRPVDAAIFHGCRTVDVFCNMMRICSAARYLAAAGTAGWRNASWYARCCHRPGRQGMKIGGERAAGGDGCCGCKDKGDLFHGDSLGGSTPTFVRQHVAIRCGFNCFTLKDPLARIWLRDCLRPCAATSARTGAGHPARRHQPAGRRPAAGAVNIQRGAMMTVIQREWRGYCQLRPDQRRSRLQPALTEVSRLWALQARRISRA